MTARVRILLLGPMRLFAGGRSVDLHGARQERIAAALALEAGRPVSVDRLIEVAWDRRAPATARRQVQDLISRLRRDLAADAGSGTQIRTHGDAYILELPDEAVDVVRFRTLAAEAQQLRPDDPGQARERLRAALALWRGEPLAGLICPALDTARLALTEQRLLATEHLIELDLDLGALPDLSELVQLVHDNPVREGIVGVYMHTLYRMGRTAEAVEAFQHLRRVLDDELGVAPGPRVRRLYDAIVRNDPDLMHTVEHAPRQPAQTQARPAPALPRDLPGFVGRQAELRWLSDLTAADGAAPVIVLCGPGGIGKTALALHWAHRAAARFPDGRIFVDLRGFSGTTSRTTSDAATRLLIALGVPASAIPPGEEALLHLYREHLSSGRSLVVLDNAASAAQVRGLIPPGPDCGVIVTSRRRLDGLVVYEGARSRTLAALNVGDSLTILHEVLGTARVDGEPGAARELIELCEAMPLALKIAAANLAAHPGQRLDEYCAKLRADRLGTLRLGDDDVTLRATFNQTYHQLTRPERRALCLLSVQHGEDIAVAAAVALLGDDAAATATILDRLVDVHFLQQPRDGHYSLHDLVREFAAERRAAEHDEAGVAAARRRLLSFYIASSDNAMAMFLPSLAGTLARDPLPSDVTPAAFHHGQQAIRWLDTEAGNLSAEACEASRQGPYRAAVQLADVLHGYFLAHRDPNRLLAVAEAGVVAARADDDKVLLARALRCLGAAHLHATGDYAAAERILHDAADLTKAIGDLEGTAHILIQLCGVTRETGRLTEALAYATDALGAAELAGALALQAGALFVLGALELDFGEWSAARGYAEQAGERYLQADTPHGVAHSLLIASEALMEMGDLDGARACAEDALRRSEQAGLDMIRVLALLQLVVVTDRDGDPRQALGLAQAGRELAEANGNPAVLAHCRISRADVLLHLDDLPTARDEYQAALEAVRGTVQPHATILAHLGLARVAIAAGDPSDAQRHAAIASEMAAATEIIALQRKAAMLREKLLMDR